MLKKSKIFHSTIFEPRHWNNFCICFLGAKDTPVENHLYCVGYGSKDSAVRLTRELHHHHEVFVSLKCNIFLSIFSSIEVPTSAEVFRLKSNSGVAKFPLAYIINTTSGSNENNLKINFCTKCWE